MTLWRLVPTLLPLCALASCAAEPAEFGGSDEVLREGIYREPQDFKTPPPLEPQVIDGTPETTKPAWKKAPASVLGNDPTAWAEANASSASNREVQDALDASEAVDRRRAHDRASARRTEGRDHARRTHRELAVLAKDAHTTRNTANQGHAKLEAQEVQALIDALRERYANAPLGRLEVAAERVHAARRRRAEQLRGVADRAREAASRAQRFAEGSAREGVIVPAARIDAKRAERKAARRELEADQAEAESRWAALAQRRIQRGLLDPSAEPAAEAPTSRPSDE